MEYNYRTASCLEDIDIQEELESFDSVMVVHPHHNLWGYEDQYKDVDYILEMMDLSEINDIKEAIRNLGFPSVYFEYVDYTDETLEEVPFTMIRYPEK